MIQQKEFLTNSAKSVYNLRWEDGGVAQQNQLQNKSTDKNSPRKYFRKHHHYQEESKFNGKLMFMPNSNTSYEAPSEPVAYYYPYAYPPRSVYAQPKEVLEQLIKPQKTNKTTTKLGIKQSEKSINLLRVTNKLKIEHYYADSPNETERIIDTHRRRGFIEIEIETPAVHPDSQE